MAVAGGAALICRDELHDLGQGVTCCVPLTGPTSEESEQFITCRRRPAVAVVPGLPPSERWRGQPTGTSHIRGSPPSPRSLPPRQRSLPRRPTARDARPRRPPPNPVLRRRRPPEQHPGNCFPSFPAGLPRGRGSVRR